MRISVDGSRIHNNKVAFLNLSGIVWTGPKAKPSTVYTVPYVKEGVGRIPNFQIAERLFSDNSQIRTVNGHWNKWKRPSDFRSSKGPS